ncbi:hypothetical protein MM239_15855 [Belliella sp. DSM 111904]|uniref:Lipoprotein n=1 Tax=Belliella filtrata TaxID=2923435 RepID=A0ABS9V397_9BACT|nr:hypothetical protein [Belliella filtrata]MCH7410883.1 hypothetical protein [Belliella filtrata]
MKNFITNTLSHTFTLFRNIVFLLYISMLGLQSCDLNPGDIGGESKQIDQEQKNQVLEYLESVSEQVEEEEKDLVLDLGKEINWSSLQSLTIREHQKLSIYSLPKTDRFSDRRIIFYTLEGEPKYAQVMEFDPIGGFDMNSMIKNVLENNEHNYSGTFTISNLLGINLVENVFSNGELISNSRLSAIEEPGKNVNSRTQGCLDWYYITYIDGVEVSRNYLFTSCTCESQQTRLLGTHCAGGGDGGGNGPSGNNLPLNPVNGQEEIISLSNGTLIYMKYSCTDSGCNWSATEMYLPLVVVQADHINYSYLPFNPLSDLWMYTDDHFFQFYESLALWKGEESKVDFELFEHPCAKEIFRKMLNNAVNNPNSDNIFDEILNLLI